MRRVAALAIGTGLWVLCHGLFASEPSLFQQANAKYQAGDFKSSADLYQKIIGTGHASSTVHYNLGNATLRLGQKGEALLYYERALKASPRDKDLRWNIQVLKNALSDRIEDKSSNPLYTPIEKVLDLFTQDELALSLGAALAAWALLALLGCFFAALRAAVGFFRMWALLFIFISAASLGLKWTQTKDPLAVILEKETTSYYGPSDRETKAFVLHEGAEGKILDESGDWVYIALKNKNTGWIRKNACEII